MATANGIKVVGFHDLPGGGQVVVRNNIAYVGHVKPPDGTSIIDVSDPSNPRELARISVPEGTLSHKVRVENELMLVNREVFPIGRVDPDFRGGLEVFDVSNPAKPTANHDLARTRDASFHVRWPLRLWIARIRRLSRQCRLHYRLQGSRRPQEVGRWWMPGQWIAGGEKPTWEGTAHRCHHPIRVGNRLYTSYWHGGFVILDIDDISKPEFISGLDWSPPFPWPTHTALPVPFPVRGRRIMLVADEDVVRLEMSAPAFLWIVDITDETRPIPFASFQVAEEDGSPKAGLHRPASVLRGNPQHRNSDRLVRAWSADRRYRQSARAARSRLVHAGCAERAQRACKAMMCASTIAA